MASNNLEEQNDFWATARLAARSPGRTEPLAWLWEELTAGRSKVVGSFSEGACLFLALRQHPGRTAWSTAFSPRKCAILKRVLAGEPQKVIAADLGVGASTVATTAAGCARGMGFECSAGRIPVLLVMAARAHSSGAASTSGPVAEFAYDGAIFKVAGAPRPTPSRLTSLSQAERQVVELLLERRTNAEIASIRRTSQRTVANQLGGVLRKLNARGRSEIVARVLERASSPAFTLSLG